MLEALEELRRLLPEELRHARWMLRERSEFLDRARAEADAIIREASSRAEQLVQRSEVNRLAEERARRIVSDAEAEARRVAREVEDFCEGRLASFEDLLARTAEAVRTGRQTLGFVPLPQQEVDLTDSVDDGDGSLFDQDLHR